MKTENCFYIISDFYADSSLLNQVLIHFGIRKYFKDIFVSSEYNARKSTGKLYEVFFISVECGT